MVLGKKKKKTILQVAFLWVYTSIWRPRACLVANNPNEIQSVSTNLGDGKQRESVNAGRVSMMYRIEFN